jgi:hypothetical protein
MSDFFNPKEEILHVELTPYGIERMKGGNLKPCYYTFHDDDVYYGDTTTDSLYEDLSKDDHSRIYKDSCYVRNFRKTDTIHPSYYNITSPLGTSKKATPFAPTIEVKLYDPKTSFLAPTDDEPNPSLQPSTGKPFKIKTGNNTNTYDLEVLSSDNITTLDLGEVIYSLEAKEMRDYDLTTIENNLDEVLGDYSTEIFSDQTFIKLNAPDILLSFLEENIDSDFENFEVEMFIGTDTETQQHFLEIPQEPRYEENIIEAGILIEKDNSEEIDNFRRSNADATTTSEYFLIEVDEEIPEHIMDKYFKNKYSSSSHSLLPQDPTSVYENTLSGPFGEDCE